MKCNSCFEIVEETKISYCQNCRESGQMCHDCVLRWGNQNNDITVCSICWGSETMENLPPTCETNLIEREIQPTMPEVVWIREDIGIIRDSECKYCGRCIFWLILWSGLSSVSTFICSFVLFQKLFVAEWLVLITCISSYIFIHKKKIWFIENALPIVLHYDGILDA